MRIGLTGRIAANSRKVKNNIKIFYVRRSKVPKVFFKNSAVGIVHKLEHRIEAIHEIIKNGYFIPGVQQFFNEHASLIAGSTGNEIFFHYIALICY